jgi:hypothetical protein
VDYVSNYLSLNPSIFITNTIRFSRVNTPGFYGGLGLHYFVSDSNKKPDVAGHASPLVALDGLQGYTDGFLLGTKTYNRHPVPQWQQT